MNVIHIWIYCLNIDFYYSYQMHTHPEQMKHTRYPLKLFFFFSPKGEIKTEKSEENFKYNEHWGEKVHRANCFNEKSGQKKQYPYFKQNPLLYTPLSLGSMTEKSFLQAFQTWKEKKERPGVRGSHCLLPGLVCIAPSGIFPVLLAVRWGSVMADAAQGSCLM